MTIDGFILAMILIALMSFAIGFVIGLGGGWRAGRKNLQDNWNDFDFNKIEK